MKELTLRCSLCKKVKNKQLFTKGMWTVRDCDKHCMECVRKYNRITTKLRGKASKGGKYWFLNAPINKSVVRNAWKDK